MPTVHAPEAEAVRTEGFQAPPQGAPTGQPQGQEAPPQGGSTPTLDPALVEMLRQEMKKTETPAEPETPEIIKPESEKPSGGLNDVDVQGLEDPYLRSLGTLLVNAAPGLDLERALGNAINYQDPDLLDEQYIREAAGGNADAVLTLASQVVRAVNEQTTQTVQSIYQNAGGEENWNAAVALFNKNAPEHMRSVARQMLDSYDYGKIKEGAQFILEYAKLQGGMVTPGEYNNPSSYSGDPSEALSKEQFQRELQKLAPEHVNPEWESQRSELFRRRALGRQLGR